MGINQFFVETLGANPGNPRWSWGAYDSFTDRVYLRVWADEFRVVDGLECVLVLRSTPRIASSGRQERETHLDRVRAGSAGFGIVCEAVDPSAHGARKIKRFNTETLIEIAALKVQDDDIYAVVGRRLPVNQLAHPPTAMSTAVADMASLIKRKSNSTHREALIQARLGQGPFRRFLLAEWGGRCAVTGISLEQVIRASHIKPWRYSTDDERLDPKNGLPLVATLDALFDSGLISFAGDGELLISPLIPQGAFDQLDLSGKRISATPDPIRQAYLEYHRSTVFRCGHYKA